MQLANQSGESDEEISPPIHTALIDSLFEASGPLLAGVVFAAIAASLTALKTGTGSHLGLCVALLIVTGAVRAFDLQRYQARKSSSDCR